MMQGYQLSKFGQYYNIEDIVDQYNTILSQLQDEYAPEKQHNMVPDPMVF